MSAAQLVVAVFLTAVGVIFVALEVAIRRQEKARQARVRTERQAKATQEAAEAKWFRVEWGLRKRLLIYEASDLEEWSHELGWKWRADA